MASRRVDNEPPKPKRPPAKTPEGREQQMIALAESVAEKQLRSGEASSQIITHYLKLASSREQKEQAKIELEMELLRKKSEALASASRVEELMVEAINAFKTYSGQGSEAPPPEEFEMFDD